MAEFGTVGMAARHVLAGAQWRIADAPMHVGAVPGLYAIHGSEDVWLELGLDHRPGIPLYIGMSKSSLAARELGQHFAISPDVAARTGGSTVRRSFAALLRGPLRLHGVPRNVKRPEVFANYALEPDADLRLTAWMHDRLTLAVWPMPRGLPLSDLEAIETDVIRAWTPPLNIRLNPGRLRILRVARSIMAAEAKAWAASATQ